MRFLSLFSGIEAASAAWLPLGWECAGVAEIEPFPCHLLAQHYGASRPRYMPSPKDPGLTKKEYDERRRAIRRVKHLPINGHYPNLGDIKQITQADIEALGQIDLVIMGFPCQDLSVAGKRKGLRDKDGKKTRSGLFFDAMRVVQWSQSRWVVGENVPGLFSSHRGRDFAAVVGEMAGCEFDVPRDGWANTGVAAGPLGLVEWCVLDAQWFGVPQRRRRVFFVRDSGDWSGRPPVLFEPESLRGHSPPRREAGERIALPVTCRVDRGGEHREAHGNNLVVPTIPARTKGGGGLGTEFDCDGGLIAVAGTLQNSGRAAGSATQQDAEAGLLVAEAYGGNNTRSSLKVATALNANGGVRSGDFEAATLLVVPIQEASKRTGTSTTDPQASAGVGSAGDPMFTLQAGAQHAVAFSCKEAGADAGAVKPPLRAMGHDSSHANGGGQVAICFDTTQITSKENRCNPQAGDPAHPLASQGHPPAVAFMETHSNQGLGVDQSPALTRERTMAVQTSMQVRRLTPRECERLQGNRDDYTMVRFGKSLAADGPRYKSLGNGMAVPCIIWIGQRIDAAVKYLRRAA